MIPRVIRLWLPSALLLSQVPGCVPLRGPSTVTGTVGESLGVACQYEEKFKTHNKYWCRVSLMLLCKDIVKTRGSEEARNGRVSIRDHPDNLTLTVALEKLTLEDAGTYMCRVDIPFIHDTFKIDDSLGIDKSFKVELSVLPAPVIALSPGNDTNIVEFRTSTPVHTQPSVTTEDTIRAPSPQPRSLLSSLYFRVLVFLELPLLLSMCGAVLWVNRPQRCSGGSSAGPCYETQ
ncbi:CMRF-35-like molecule 4 isoform X1 [Apodemus sylvaticus]|uniref:CMRF-35-like molecule 4 isoform X1 n=1 Tax=Apodemus sylvaticus TaxID=10129 RepID=UPI002241AD04|nr:CMRF-35-like molecule 4 isoform X1 [Apodemus sylvaticus]